MTKRIFALLMSLCMIFSMLPVLGASAAGTETEVSFSHIGYQGDYPRYLVYLNLEDVTDVSATTVPGGSKVVATVNGAPMNLWAYDSGTSQVFLVFEVALGNYLVEIDAGTAIGSYTVKSDLKFKIEEYTATQLEIIHLGIDTAKGSSGINYGGFTNTRYGFYLTGFSGYDSWNKEHTLLINGTEHTQVGDGTTFEYCPVGEDQLLFVYYNYLKEGATDCADITEVQTISIPAGTVFGNCITENTLSFTIQQWTFEVLPDAVNIQSTNGSAWNESQYILYLQTDLPFALTATQGLTIRVNGTEQNAWLYPGDTPFIACESAAAYGENEIVIPAGTKLGNCVTAQDYTLYTHEDGTINQTPPASPTVSFSFSRGQWQAENSRYLVWLEDDLTGEVTVPWKPLDILTVDGTDCSVYAVVDSGMVMLILDSTVGLGQLSEHTVTVKKGTFIGDYEVASDITFYTHADGTVDLTPPAAPVNFSFSRGQWQESNSRYLVWLEDDLAGEVTVPWKALDILTVDGTDYSVYAVVDSGMVMLILDSTVGLGQLSEHTVTVKKGTFIGDYEVASDITFYTHANGTVDQTPPAAPVNFSFSRGQWQESNSRYLVWLEDDLAEEVTVPWKALDILTVDGTDCSVYAVVDSGMVMLILDSTVGLGQLSEHTVTVKKGTFIGDYEVASDITFYTHKDGTVDVLPAAATPVNATGIDKTVSKYMTTGYHVYFNMSDPDFELTTYPQTITVQMDGADKVVTLWNNGKGSLLIDCDNVSLDYHRFTVPAGTVIGDYVLENAYSFRTYTNGMVGEEDRGEVILNNATAMMGGSYGDGLFYDLSGSFEGANWIANAIAVDGNITMEYVKLSEAKDAAWYGPARWVSLNNQWPNVFGVVLHTTNGTFANDYNLTNMVWTYRTDEHLAYFRNAAGELQVPTDYGYISDWNTYMTDNLLTTKDFAGIDEKGAQYFGIGWGGSGNYTLDWTKLMIYDAQGNDLGVAWYADGANVTLTPMVEYGKTVYLKAADNNGLKVTGWKVVDLEGNQISVAAAQDANGVWSFAVPEDTMSIEPIYASIDLTVADHNGKVLVQNNINWLSDNIQLAAKQVEAAIPAGYVLKGYAYGGALYPSLESIPVAEDTTVLNVTAVTLQFTVQEQTDIRHGETLADSGLRFVATLGQTEYIPKILLISDSEETLNVADAQWKIGNPYDANFTEIACADGTVAYSIALTNIPAADYSKTYYARAGILVTYADGSQNYIYTDTVAATVNEAAQNTYILSDARTAYINGVMNLNADAQLVGNYDYSISVDKSSGNYIITYTESPVSVSALTIDGLRFTAEDGVVFGTNAVTVPNGLFANAKLQKELTQTGAMDIGAYFGPSVGRYQYTESGGTVTDKSVKRTHDQVYADVEDYFNAGFNIWMAEDWVYGGTQYGTNDAFSALDLAAEYCLNHGLTKSDIQVLVSDQFINGLLDGTDMNNGDRNDVATYAHIAEERINALINYNPVVNGVQVGTEYNCFAGYMLRDEPWYKHMKYYAPWFSFLAADETETATVTAWNTSGAEVSGNVSCMGLLSKGYTLYFSFMGLGANKNYVTDSTSTSACTEAEYMAYVNAFVDNVNATVWNYDNMVLAFDNYGLYSNASSSFGSTSVNYTEEQSDNWQQNLSLFADLVQSKNPNAKFATALRSFGMTRKSMASRWTSKTWKEFKAFDSAWGEQAVSMQAYTALAHGYGNLSYFSYWETQNQAYAGETFTDACVMWDANMNPVKQNMYYWVQSANAELRQLENLISNFSYEETAAIAANGSFYTGTGNVADTGMGGLWTAAQLADSSALASISANVDTTAGYFSKDSGEFTNMFILVNMSHPNEKTSDTVSMTFDAGYTAVIVYLDGVASIYQLANGACTVTLPSGEGAIVIPVA